MKCRISIIIGLILLMGLVLGVAASRETAVTQSQSTPQRDTSSSPVFELKDDFPQLLMYRAFGEATQLDPMRGNTVEDAPSMLLTVNATSKTMPYWKALLLVYKNIDTDYTDSNGTPQHLTYTMSAAEIEDGVAAFRQYPSLAQGASNKESFVQYDIIYVDRPLATVTSLGTNLWWPSPTDTRIELDTYVAQNYDSVLVLWPQSNFATGQQIPSYWGLGLRSTSWANGATYATVANAPIWMWESPTVGEPWLHEWLHGVSPFYVDRGFPMPAGDADGADEHGYVHSQTTGWMSYYNDLMTGNVLENNNLTGISAAAWRSGSILGKVNHVFADYFRTDSLSGYQQLGAVSWDAANERVQMNSSPPAGNKISVPVTFMNDFTAVGRVNIPQSSVGFYDSISVALGNGQVEYWGTLAYGTALAERNNISIMRNDTWGSLYPITLNAGWYTVKMQVEYEQGIMRMKVWADGTNEPNWQVSRFLDANWTATNLGYRHFGTAVTFVDDIYAIEESYQAYLPMIIR